MLKHYTEKKIIQLLSTQSRRVDISPYQLSQVHIEMGKYLGGEILEEIPIQKCEIQHPQGTKIGYKISNESNIFILNFLRAGIYVGDGLRYIFQYAPTYHIAPEKNIGISKKDFDKFPSFENKIIILVDSVINTGSTMKPAIKQVLEKNPFKIIVASLVVPEQTALQMEKEFPNIYFFIARISDNMYSGVGKTDTGNRLFATFA